MFSSQMFLDPNCQQPAAQALLARISENCTLGTSGWEPLPYSIDPLFFGEGARYLP